MAKTLRYFCLPAASSMNESPQLTFHVILCKNETIESDYVIYFDSSCNHLYNTFSVFYLFVFF